MDCGGQLKRKQRQRCNDRHVVGTLEAEAGIADHRREEVDRAEEGDCHGRCECDPVSVAGCSDAEPGEHQREQRSNDSGQRDTRVAEAAEELLKRLLHLAPPCTQAHERRRTRDRHVWAVGRFPRTVQSDAAECRRGGEYRRATAGTER